MELTPKHFTAIRLMYEGKSKEEIALQLKVSTTTVGRWANDPDFKKAVVDNAVQQIGTLVPEAVTTIRNVMKSENSRQSDKLNAAKTILEMAHIADKAAMDANINLRVEYV